MASLSSACDYSNSWTPQGLKITCYVGMKYEHEASFNADWAYRGKIPTTLQNDDPAIPRGIQDSWRKARGILNLNLSYDMPDQQLTFSVFGTNVTDERYQVQGLAFNTLGYLGTTQEPRMWGVSVRKAFGEE